jgi:UV DNA damage endonuclease
MGVEMNIGYACNNMQLNTLAKKGVEKVLTGRGMIKRTFKTKGLEYVSEISLKNAKDLDTIVKWNISNGYKFFRIGSDLFPWASEYDIDSLKDIKEIRKYLHSAGVQAKTHGLRLTCHPGHFNVLPSPSDNVVERCITDLSINGKLFDMIGLSRTPYNKINIHLGGAYGDKESAMKRFCVNFERLPDSVKSRLTVENDDKASMYSVRDLYDGVYTRIGIPIVFDYHHHQFCTGDLSEQQALELAMSTWPDGITPATHYSESRRDEQENPKIKPQAHSDYVYKKIETYGNVIDVMVEAKAKELAVQKYKELHLC